MEQVAGVLPEIITNPNLKNIILTENDLNNINSLKEAFKENNNIKVLHSSIDEIDAKFDSILYFHVLEHIENDLVEIENAKKKIKRWRAFNYYGSCTSKNIWKLR